MNEARPFSTLEIAAGTVFGTVTDWPPLRDYRTIASPRAAIEQVVRHALSTPPCVVSFSGGRDSSAVLALAAHVARRDGLEPPIPVTLRFPECETSLETDWQELVVTHLGLSDWHRVEFTDELDLIGPISQQVLTKHGLLWPFNAYFHVPIIDLARGGCVLTGVGGDELFSSSWAWHRENLVASRRARPKPMDIIRLPIAIGPRMLRKQFLRKRHQTKASSASTPWFRPEAQAEVLERRLNSAAHETISFKKSVANSWWPLGSRIAGANALDALAKEGESRCISPLCAPEFLFAMTRQQGWRGFSDRTEAMQGFVGDLLPPNLISRPTKAYFDSVFWNHYSREFVAQWDGQGVDPSVVDVDALRELWTKPGDTPDARTFTLLQAAWLASTGHSSAAHA